MVIAPEFRVVEFDVSSATSGAWTGFVDTTTRVLDYGQVDNSQSGVNSTTKVVALSGVEFNGNSTIEDMKFYLLSLSAFAGGTYEFLMDITNTWTQNKVVTQANSNVPTTLPASQNYFRLGGGTQITGSGQVDGLGQWLYLAVFIGTDVPDGTYGGLGDNSFRYRFRFDYF